MRRPLSYYFSGDVCWLRIFGYGVGLSRNYPTFSERYGYVRYIQLPFGWRLRWLR